MIKKLILLLMLIPGLAEASVCARQHADTIVDDKKILASDLNDEFDELVNCTNSIDGSNILAGSITTPLLAATSSAFQLNRRLGCQYELAPADFRGSKTIAVTPPCEVVIDGYRGVITATQNIDLISNLADGSLATSNYYYIYATLNSGSLGFQFSQQKPIVSTARKITDSQARYLGTIRTQDATQDIVSFYQDGNHIYWDQLTATQNTGIVATGGAVSASFTLSVPEHWESVFLKYTAFTNATTKYPAVCGYEFSNVTGAKVNGPYQAVVIATGSNVGMIPYPVVLDRSANVRSIPLRVINYSNCGLGNVRVTGWTEPDVLYK